jgi:hypothetical protein
MRWLDKEVVVSDDFCDVALSMVVEELDVIDAPREDAVDDSLSEASDEVPVPEGSFFPDDF